MPLALTRRINEDIQLRFPDDITDEELRKLVDRGITVRLAEVKGQQAILAFEAPRFVNIVRSELLEDAPTHPHPDAADPAPAR